MIEYYAIFFLTQLNQYHSLIWLNLFHYFEFTGQYASLHLHMEGGEDIADELIPHTEYRGTVYTYITDSFGSSSLGCPRTEI